MEKSKVFLPLLTFTLLILCGCSNNSDTLDHRSIQYQNHVFSIGDTQEEIENILGKGRLNLDTVHEDHYIYNDGSLVIGYVNDRAVYLEARNSLEGYSMLNFDPSMSEEEVAEVFTDEFSASFMSFYNLYFDQDGNTTDTEHEVAYTACVYFEDGILTSIYISKNLPDDIL